MRAGDARSGIVESMAAAAGLPRLRRSAAERRRPDLAGSSSAFVFMLFVGAMFSTLGGLLGAAIFRKRRRRPARSTSLAATCRRADADVLARLTLRSRPWPTRSHCRDRRSASRRSRFPPSPTSAPAPSSATSASTRDADRDPEAFWARFAGELEWSRPWDTVLDWKPPHAKWFVGGTAQRERQLPRSARPRPAPQQGRAHLGRRAGRSPHADLLRSAIARSRQFANVLKSLGVKKGDRVAHLPAAHSRARHRDARLRAHRRGPQRRVRRLQRRVAARSHQRRAGAPARHRRRRLPPRPDRPAQADGRRSARRHAVDRARRRRAARAATADPGPHARRDATTGITS